MCPSGALDQMEAMGILVGLGRLDGDQGRLDEDPRASANNWGRLINVG